MTNPTSERTERGFADTLAAILRGECEVGEAEEADAIREVVTYEDAGVLTLNAGLVVRMDDGSEFQITVVRSRGPHR
jgi:hypothetical protein